MAELSHRQILKFKTLISQLNDLIEDIRVDIPDAQFYVEDGTNFYILDGPSHDDTPRPEEREGCRLAHTWIKHCDCGAW